MVSIFPSQQDLGSTKTAIIVAMTRDRVIGKGGQIPWTLPEDLALFKRLTTGNTLIMGRRTHASIGHPLAGRHNIVISRSLPGQAGLTVCRSFREGTAEALRIGRPIFFIGGAEIYAEALPIVNELHISWIEDDYEGDTYFPTFSRDSWTERSREQYQGFYYSHYQRKK